MGIALPREVGEEPAQKEKQNVNFFVIKELTGRRNIYPLLIKLRIQWWIFEARGKEGIGGQRRKEAKQFCGCLWGASAKYDSGIGKKTLTESLKQDDVVWHGQSRMLEATSHVCLSSDDNTGVQPDTHASTNIYLHFISAFLICSYLVPLPGWETILLLVFFHWFEGLFYNTTLRHAMKRCSKTSADHHEMTTESNLGNFWDIVQYADLQSMLRNYYY